MIIAVMLVAGLSGGDSFAKALETRLADCNPTNGLSRFVDYRKNARQDVFVPNPRFWAKGIDFSCASPWNGASGALKAGTLVSKRHIVYASHFPLPIGSRILFVDGEGNVCPCYLEKAKGISGTDITIGSLDSEVTPNIKPARLLPDDFHEHLENSGAGMPIVTFNQSEKLFLTESNPILTNKMRRAYATCRIPQSKRLAAFRERVVVGDSGNPAFLLIGGEPVLLYCLHTGGCGAGPALHLYKEEIQKTMDELCPGYKLEFYRFRKLP